MNKTKIAEIKELFDRIKLHYNVFTFDSNKLSEWHRFLKEYSKDDVNKRLDEYLKEEKTALYEGANFVEDGGSLVYCINTVNQKEGRLMIEAFLNDHPEFSLTEEKQKFGFGDGDACFYYAILVKGVNRD